MLRLSLFYRQVQAQEMLVAWLDLHMTQACFDFMYLDRKIFAVRFQDRYEDFNQ